MSGRLGIALVWGLCAGLAVNAADLPTQLSIATYNVANYNLTDRQIEGAFMTAYPKPEREKTALRRVIRDLDVDVLALQEIGGEPFLRELQRDLRGEGLDYSHAVVLEASDETRRLAVLSRVPFTHIGRHTDLEFKYFEGREVVKRGMLEVRLETSAGELALFVVHFKSRLTERRDDPAATIRRGREAMAARDRVLELFPNPAEAKFLVIGDFNEGPQERPVRAFQERGSLAIARLIPAADSRAETWTHLYRRNDEYSRVDFLMVSEGLTGAIPGQGGQVYDGSETLKASDHRPVWVRLDLGALAVD